MSENNACKVEAQPFMDALTIQLPGRPAIKISVDEGRELAVALNTHFARHAKRGGYVANRER